MGGWMVMWIEEFEGSSVLFLFYQCAARGRKFWHKMKVRHTR